MMIVVLVKIKKRKVLMLNKLLHNKDGAACA
jgi:hypothetical protein